MLKGARIKRMSELPAAMTGGVTMQVQSQEELKNLRIWEQGDANLYTREALEQRYANRSHKDVWNYLNIWWTSAMVNAGEAADADRRGAQHPKRLGCAAPCTPL